MGDGLLILGNGFDLDLGLHTRYSDFWKSERWKEVKTSCPEPYFVKSLENYRITHHWFDLESGLKEGASSLVNRLKKDFDASNYYSSFQMLIKELKDYIQYQQEHFEPKDDSVALQLLQVINRWGSLKCIYTFNYTDLKYICERFHISNLPPLNYMHGSLKSDDQIILGIEVEDFSSIPPQLTFLIKSNSPYYHYSNLLTDLNNADNVIFFGHSINGMDFPYFKEYFLKMANMPINQDGKPQITIITYDEQSARQIKDNFRANGIDVRSLYNKVILEFILTKSIYEGNPKEKEKLRILTGGIM